MVVSRSEFLLMLSKQFYFQEEMKNATKGCSGDSDAVNTLLTRNFMHWKLMSSSVMSVKNERGKSKTALDPDN